MDAQAFTEPVYYCDPKAPYQRGSVENAIGLARQYIPKRTSIRHLANKDIYAIAAKLNHRPRKCLAYRTPYEVMFDKTVALAF